MTDKPAESAVERYNDVAHSDGFMLATHPPYTFAEFRDLADDAIAELKAKLAAADERVEERDAEWAKLRGLLTAMGRQGPALKMMARIEADRKQDR